MKRVLILLIVLMVVLGGCGITTTDTTGGRVKIESQERNAKSNEADWKTIYSNVLEELELTEQHPDYSLYDITSDGIPELFVGTSPVCEGLVYGIEQNTAIEMLRVDVGEMFTGFCGVDDNSIIMIACGLDEIYYLCTHESGVFDTRCLGDDKNTWEWGGPLPLQRLTTTSYTFDGESGLEWNGNEENGNKEFLESIQYDISNYKGKERTEDSQTYQHLPAVEMCSWCKKNPRSDETFSFYCSSCECAKPGCIKLAAVGSSPYCDLHK